MGGILFDNVGGSTFGFFIDSRDIFADHAEHDDLDAPEQKDCPQGGCPPRYGRVGNEFLVQYSS